MKKILLMILTTMLLLSNITPSLISADTKSVNVNYVVSAKVTYLQYDGTSTTQKVKVGETLKEPKHKKRKGHTFIGWRNKETGKTWNFHNPVEEHMTLVAVYQADTTENKDDKGKISSKTKATKHKTRTTQKNEKSILTSPKAGDTADPSMYGIALVLSGMFMAFLVTYAKRKKINK